MRRKWLAVEGRPEIQQARPRAIDALLGPLILMLLLAQMLIFLGQITSLSSSPAKIITNDAVRYHEIAHEQGKAYRDFEVEFPPLAFAAIKLLDGPDVRDTAARLGWFSWGLQLVTVAIILWAWGRRAAYHYLVFTLPLSLFLFFRIDLLSVALATAGLALVLRRREALGGVALAAAVLAKGWPLLIFPVLLVKRLRSATVWFIAALAIGTGIWLAIGGLDGISQVVTFRHAHGWHIYSTPGILTILFTNAEPMLDAGSSRVGSAALWLRLLLLVPFGAYLVATTVKAWRRPEDSHWRLPVGNLSALLFLAPLVSEQYVSWLGPWVAIGASQDQRLVEVLGVVISILTVVVLFPSLGPALLFELLTLARNLLLLALALLIVVPGIQQSKLLPRVIRAS